MALELTKEEKNITDAARAWSEANAKRASLVWLWTENDEYTLDVKMEAPHAMILLMNLANRDRKMKEAILHVASWIVRGRGR